MTRIDDAAIARMLEATVENGLGTTAVFKRMNEPVADETKPIVRLTGFTLSSVTRSAPTDMDNAALTATFECTAAAAQTSAYACPNIGSLLYASLDMKNITDSPTIGGDGLDFTHTITVRNIERQYINAINEEDQRLVVCVVTINGSAQRTSGTSRQNNLT